MDGQNKKAAATGGGSERSGWELQARGGESGVLGQWSSLLDLPLFEDRKPDPSQHFDCIEIYPSDMQVDSPPSKKIIDSGDGDIKPNKCHDSDEVGVSVALLLWTSLITIVTFRMTMIWVTKDAIYSEIEKLGLRNFSRYPHFRT